MLITRILRLLTILAVLFAPLSMAGGHAAMAVPAPQQAQPNHAQMADMPTGHCADMDQGDRSDRRAPAEPRIDCMMACSVIVTSAEICPDAPLPAMQMGTTLPATFRDGLHPESDPPPPRIS